MLVQVGPHNWHMVTAEERERMERRAVEIFNRVEIDPMSLPQAETHAATSAPKVTKADIEAQIASVHFLNAFDAVNAAVRQANAFRKVDEPNKEYAPWELQVLTICLMVLKNGFTIVGTSACVSPENYDRALGEKIAREKAIDQIWPLMGYELRGTRARKAESAAKVEAALFAAAERTSPGITERVRRDFEPMDLTRDMEVKVSSAPIDHELEKAFRVIEDRIRARARPR